MSGPTASCLQTHPRTRSALPTATVLIDPAALKFDCSIANHIVEGQPLPAGDIMIAGGHYARRGRRVHVRDHRRNRGSRTARGDVIVKLGPFEGPHDVTVNLILNP